MKNSEIKIIKDLVAKNRVKEAIATVVESIKSEDLRNELILLQNNFESYRKEELQELVSREESNVSKNKITIRFLEILDRLNFNPEIDRNIWMEKALEVRQNLDWKEKIQKFKDSNYFEVHNEIEQIFREVSDQILQFREKADFRFGIPKINERYNLRIINWQHGSFVLRWPKSHFKSLKDFYLSLIIFDQPSVIEYDPLFVEGETLLVNNYEPELDRDELIVWKKEGNFFSKNDLITESLELILENYNE